MKNPQFYNVLIKPLGDTNINEVLKVNPCYPRHWRVHTGVVVKRGVRGECTADLPDISSQLKILDSR